MSDGFAPRAARASSQAPWLLPAFAALFAAAIRLPFLGAGYGWDSDAWRMAAAAQQIAKTGHYAASRAPGYPLTELADAALARLGPWGTSPWATNGLRALWAALAAASFVVLARRLRAPSPLLLACAFTSVPAVFVAGVSTLDAMGSLACGVTALAFAAERRPWLAGVLVGLAAGMRPTALVFALPVAVMLPRRDVLVAVATALVTGALGYAPALIAGGASAFAYYDLGYPAATLVVKKATLDLWGPLGLLGLAVAAAWTLARGRDGRDASPPAAFAPPQAAVAALVLGLIAFAALYLRLPYKALYLAPAVPFALLLFAGWARPAALRTAIILLVLSPWLGSVYEPGKTDDPAPSPPPLGTTLGLRGHAVRVEARGAARMDHLRRERGMAQGRAIVAAAEELPVPSLVVVGDALPMLRVLTGVVGGPLEIEGRRFVHHLDHAALAEAREARRPIYVAPGALGSPSARFGEDPAALGARLLELQPTTNGEPR